jgi:hypothetical protein
MSYAKQTQSVVVFGLLHDAIRCYDYVAVFTDGLTFRNRASYKGRTHRYPPNTTFYVFF